MILGFADKRTEKVWKGEFSKDLPTEVQLQARKKLRMINNAMNIDDLKVPPGNKLEPQKAIEKGSLVFELMISGGSVSPGTEIMQLH